MVWLVNAAQVDKLRKDQKYVVVLDASWHLPEDNRDAAAEFAQQHLVGARFFDITSFNDPDSTLPNMLTRNEQYIAEKLGALGITNEHKIIFYDKSKLHSSCRAAWMMKVFGHPANQIYVLDGGLDAWEKYGGKTEVGDAKAVSAKTYNINYESHFIRTLVQMKTNLHHPSEQVIDVRHPVRFAGGKEHRPHTRSGHIPGSFCFPYMTMFEADGRFKPMDKIQKLLNGLGIDFNYPIVTMCGSGVTAAILDVALDLMNQTPHALYDGSWSEWGAEQLYHGESSADERPVIRSLDV